jgi:PAS domain-containing protein
MLLRLRLAHQRLAARTAELERSRNALQAIIENVPAAIYVKDLEGRYLRHNALLARVLAMPASHWSASTTAICSTGRTPRAWPPRQASRNEGQVLRAEHQMPGANGEIRTSRPMSSPAGRQRQALRDRRHLARHHRSQARPARGRVRHAREERVPGQHEPRDPHADERDPRHVATWRCKAA